MTAKPCAIPACPALAADGSDWCAIHSAMSDAERQDEQREGERRQFHRVRLTPVTDRIDYEKS